MSCVYKKSINLLDRFTCTVGLLGFVYCVIIAYNQNHSSTRFGGPAILVVCCCISCTYHFTNILANMPHIAGIFIVVAIQYYP